MNASQRQKLLDDNRLRQAELTEATVERLSRIAAGDYDYQKSLRISGPIPLHGNEPPMTQQQRNSEAWAKLIDQKINAALGLIGDEMGTAVGKVERELREQITALQLRIDQLEASARSNKGWWK
jgi:hypothetical protein